MNRLAIGRLRVTALAALLIVGGAALPAAAQELTVGGIRHTVDAWATYRVLPASMAQGAMRGKVSDKEPVAGTRWYVVRGVTTNTLTAQKTFGFGTIWLSVDGTEVKPSSASAFQPADTSVMRSVKLAPGARTAWVAFFQVPTAARDVRLQLTNLDQLTRRRVVGSLPLAGNGGRMAAGSAASAPAAPAAPAPRAAAPARPAAASGLTASGLQPFRTKIRAGQLSLLAPLGAVAGRTPEGAMAVSAPGFKLELNPGIGMLSKKKEDVRNDGTERFTRLVTDAPPTGMVYESLLAGRPRFHVYYILKNVGGGLVCSDARGSIHTEAQARTVYEACSSVQITP